MLYDLDRAWAAGFFDGEGTIGLYPSRRCQRLSLQVPQKDRYVLDRFNRSTGNYGRIYKRTDRVLYYYAVYKAELIQKVVDSIFEFLSPVKQKQIEEAFQKYNNYKERSRHYGTVPSRLHM